MEGEEKPKPFLGLLWCIFPKPTGTEVLNYVKRTAPAIFTVLLLSILILIKPVERAIGPDAFIVLVYMHLFFFPGSPLGEHFENVLLNLLSCAIGLGITFITIAGAIWIDDDPTSAQPYKDTRSKALAACVLVSLCLIGGFFYSYAPRLRTAVRTMLFGTTWTMMTGSTVISSRIFTNQFYPAALAAGASLLSAMLLFPRTAHDECGRSLVYVLNLQRQVLKQSFLDFFLKEFPDRDSRIPSRHLIDLRNDLQKGISSLTSSYENARNELSVGRIPITTLRPLLSYTRRTKGWTVCGMGLRSHDEHSPSDVDASGVKDASNTHHSRWSTTREDEEMLTVNNEDNYAGSSSTSHGMRKEKTVTFRNLSEGSIAPSARKLLNYPALQEDIRSLLDQVLASLQLIESCILLTMSKRKPQNTKFDDPRWDALYNFEDDSLRPDKKQLPARVILAQQKRLASAIDTFQSCLDNVLREITSISLANKSEESLGANKGAILFDDVFYKEMYEISFLMVTILEVGKDTIGALKSCQTLLVTWQGKTYPRILLPTVPFSGWIRSKSDPFGEAGEVFRIEDSDEQRFNLEFSLREQQLHVHPTVKRKTRAIISEWSHYPAVISWRVTMSKHLTTFKSSLHIRYAVKLALGVALLSLLGWLPGSQEWFRSERGVWLIVTYIWVLELNSGATFRIAVYRAIGTITGAIYGIIAWYICAQGNRPAIALFLVLAEIPASYFILYSKRAQTLGVVFGLTQSLVLLIPLVETVEGEPSASVPLIGLRRAYQILIGNVAAVIVNLLIWPLHARTFLVHLAANVTHKLSTVYLSLARQMLNEDTVVSPHTSLRFEKLEDKIQREINASHGYLDVMQLEVSLIPKPIETLRIFLDTLQRTRNWLVLLRRVRETALQAFRKQANFNILNIRKELVSSLLLSLWIVAESMLTKTKLPQFLPSCRAILHDLTIAMQQHSFQATNGNFSGCTSTAQGPALDRPTQDQIHTPDKRTNEKTTEEESQILLENAHDEDKALEYSPFFVFAEHVILSELIFEIEKLLVLTKLLVGESQFIRTHFLPRPQSRSGQKSRMSTLQGGDSYWDSLAHHDLESWVYEQSTSLPQPVSSSNIGRRRKPVNRSSTHAADVFSSCELKSLDQAN